MRRLITLSKSVTKLSHHVRLNVEARSDIQWWHTFLDNWNGVSLLAVAGNRILDTTFTSDASGSWGCRAYWKRDWFQLAWDEVAQTTGKNIAIQELLPVVLAVAVWGRAWTGLCIQCRCDNEAVIMVLNSRSSKDKDLMHLLRCLFFFESEFQFNIVAAHIPGNLNTLADALSRGSLTLFMQQASQEVNAAILLPHSILSMLVTHQPDWTSSTWRQKFRYTLRQV